MIDIERSGYDNLFLVAGHDWYAKLAAVMGGDPAEWDKTAVRLAANFDRLDKSDAVNVAKWENELLKACGMPGKPLPKVAKPAPVEAPKVEEPKEEPKLVEPPKVEEPAPTPPVEGQ